MANAPQHSMTNDENTMQTEHKNKLTINSEMQSRLLFLLCAFMHIGIGRTGAPFVCCISIRYRRSPYLRL